MKEIESWDFLPVESAIQEWILTAKAAKLNLRVPARRILFMIKD